MKKENNEDMHLLRSRPKKNLLFHLRSFRPIRRGREKRFKKSSIQVFGRK